MLDTTHTLGGAPSFLDTLTPEQREMLNGQIEERRAELARRRGERMREHLRLASDEEYRAGVLEWLRSARSDAEADIYFINTFCWTHDGRDDPTTGRVVGRVEMLLDEEQEEFVRWYNRTEAGTGPRSGHAVKSRDRGCTWLMVYLRVRRFLFWREYSTLFGHQLKEYAIDATDPKSIIWKFDYTLRNLRDDAYTAFLVEELKAAGYWDKKQWQTEGIRIHPARPAVVFKGGAVTEDWGGGDRFFDAWMDEAPLTGQNALQGKRAYDKVGHSCNLRWTVGTPPPEGMANWWSQLVNPDLAPSVAGSAAAASRPRSAGTFVNRFDMKWERDPRKNAFCLDPHTGAKVFPWYEQQKRENDDEAIASELDRNFQGSVKGQVYPAAGKLARNLVVPYDPQLATWATMDPGWGDNFAIAWIQYDPFRHKFRVFQTYKNKGKKASFYLAVLFGSSCEHLLAEGAGDEDDRLFMRRADAFRYTGFFGDPTARKVEITTGRSIFDEMREVSRKIDETRFLFHVEVGAEPRADGKPNIAELWKDHVSRQKALRKLIPYLEVDSEWASDLIPALEMCRYPKRTENATAVNAAPVHSTPGRDLVTALEVFALSDVVERILEGTGSRPVLAKANGEGAIRAFRFGADPGFVPARDVQERLTPGMFTPSGQPLYNPDEDDPRTRSRILPQFSRHRRRR